MTITIMRGLAAASLGLAAFAAAPATAATEVFIQGASIPPVYGTFYSNTGGIVTQEGAALISLAVNVGVGMTATPIYGAAFCVDLFHPVYVGLGSFYPTNVQYHVAPLTTDSSGNPLSLSQIDQIGGLAALGFSLSFSGLGQAEIDTRQAAIQRAIWEIEYPGTTFYDDMTNPLPGLGAYAAQYIADAPNLHGHPYVINTDAPGAAQNLIISFSSQQLGIVPEPQSWALLIAGFGMVGVASRRRRIGTTIAA